jgi:predicted RNA binding protein YcfA (HicA-like mRNA interferase family)
MTAKEILKILHEDGWIVKNQQGSHVQLVHPTKKGKVTIPCHKGDLNRDTLNSIIKQAGLK